MNSSRKLNQPSPLGVTGRGGSPLAQWPVSHIAQWQCAPAPHRRSCRRRPPPQPQQAVSSVPTNPPGTAPRFAVATKMKCLPLS
ncbi:hypothetical protein GQ55_6G228200 [Panicum hallii var. hallii]|uniref:Uncharacterized protein n=1 Tax=Panicum hallii var. hallii TaxID=1504633 RepID=A0A2T7D8J6_9POAL|nr:hypothetical protein GQ55_6G228200 [Panicum hallii var. hallii]